jgi:hypothetical protein
MSNRCMLQILECINIKIINQHCFKKVKLNVIIIEQKSYSLSIVYIMLQFTTYLKYMYSLNYLLNLF